MSYSCRILQSDDLELIQSFEQKTMEAQYPDEMERMIAGWNSRTRIEAFTHYLALGWSFAAFDVSTEELAGYFIAQPLLFLDGQTQSLWVEHVNAQNSSAYSELCELAYKLGREKHLQRVYFPKQTEVQKAIEFFKPTEWESKAFVVKTTKG